MILASMNITHWLEAARLRTLPLAIANMAMGNGLAAMAGSYKWSIAVLSIATAIALQILSNFANDYGDTINGADNDTRQGPARAVQSGVISLPQMKTAIYLTAGVALVIGVGLLMVSFDDLTTIFIFVIIGLIAIWAAYNYTAGSNPYGYVGLGDISVFIFFGLVAVIGCFYLQTKAIPFTIILPAVTCGLLSVGVLNVNNIRDIDSDLRAGKRSIPVMIGKDRAIAYHGALLLISWICLIIFSWITDGSLGKWAYLLLAPLFVKQWIDLKKAPTPQAIDPFLKKLALSTALLILVFLLSHLALSLVHIDITHD